MGHPTTQEKWWAGDGGTEYLRRNRVDWYARCPFWQAVLDRAQPRSVYEFGCNAGWNLSAIRYLTDGFVQCYGHDLNAKAVAQANAAGLREVFVGASYDEHVTEFWPEERFDLSFTAGVLIHIPPAELEAFMRSVIRVSAQYVLAVEYYATWEEEIEYRGQSGLLWKRPYVTLYGALGLKLVHEWKPAEVVGFDNCHAWLFEKP